VPPLIFGVAFGNLLQGVPFHFDNNLVSTYDGSFWGLLNPFALLCGVVSSAMITFHGGVYLAHRTEGAIQQRAALGAGDGPDWLAGFTLAGIWLALGLMAM
jgi:cytochrome d ubiquinol oxidase subunit II